MFRHPSNDTISISQEWKNGKKAQGNHKAYAAWAFSAKLQQLNTKDWLNNDGEISKVTIYDNEALKRKRKKKRGGGNTGE